MAKSKTYWGSPHSSAKRFVPDAPTKTARYEGGFYPGSMSARETAEVIGLDGERATADSPIVGHGEQPNKHATAKAEENAHLENAHPDLPRPGTLGRS